MRNRTNFCFVLLFVLLALNSFCFSQTWTVYQRFYFDGDEKDHFTAYASEAGEVMSLGYVPQDRFHASSSNFAGSVRLRRAYSTYHTDHYQMKDPEFSTFISETDDSYDSEGPSIYIFGSSEPMLEPMYHLYKTVSGHNDNVLAIGTSDKNSLQSQGYTLYPTSPIGYVQPQPPKPPTLSYPADGATITTTRPRFEWIAPYDQQHYQVVIFNDPSCLDEYIVRNRQTFEEGESGTDNYWDCDITLSSGTYWWKASVSCSGGGTSGLCSSRSFTIEAPCSAPARPSSYSEYSITNNSARINWNSVTEAEGYEYRYGRSSSIPTSGTTTSNSFVNLAGLSPSTRYYWWVRSYACSPRQYSSWSSRQSFITTTPCTTPGRPSTITLNSISEDSARLYWTTVSEAEGYEYYYSTSTIPSSSWTTTYNYANLSRLTPGTTYYFNVRSYACTPRVYSAWNTYSFRTEDAAPHINLLSPADGSVITDPSITFTWESVGDISPIEFQMSTNSHFSGGCSEVLGFSTASTSFTRSIPFSGDIYWRVKGQTDDGETEWTSARRIIRSYTPESGVSAINWDKIPDEGETLTLGETFIARANIFASSCDLSVHCMHKNSSSSTILEETSHFEDLLNYWLHFDTSPFSKKVEFQLPTDTEGEHTVKIQVNRDPIYYLQTDTNWSSEVMGSGSSTINDFGCTITCYSMLLNYYGMQTVDPLFVNNWINEHSGYRSDGSLITWYDPERISDELGGSVTYVSCGGGEELPISNYPEIDEYLEESKPVILEVYNGCDGDDCWPWHWVLVYKKVSDTYSIRDPYYASRTTLDYYHNQIRKYLLYDGDPSAAVSMSSREITYNVVASTSPTPWSFRMTSDVSEQPADGMSEFNISGYIQDAYGYPVTEGSFDVDFSLDGNAVFASGSAIAELEDVSSTTDGVITTTLRTTTRPGHINLTASVENVHPSNVNSLSLNSYDIDNSWRADYNMVVEYKDRLSYVSGKDFYYNPSFDVSSIESFLASIGESPSSAQKESLKRLRLALRAINLSLNHDNSEFNDPDFPKVVGIGTLIHDVSDGIAYFVFKAIEAWVKGVSFNRRDIYIDNEYFELIAGEIVDELSEFLLKISAKLPSSSKFRYLLESQMDTIVVVAKSFISNSTEPLHWEAMQLIFAKAVENVLYTESIQPRYQNLIDYSAEQAITLSYSGTYEQSEEYFILSMRGNKELSEDADNFYNDMTSDWERTGSTIDNFFTIINNVIGMNNWTGSIVGIAECARITDIIFGNLSNTIENAFYNGGLYRTREEEFDDIVYFPLSTMSLNEQGVRLESLNNRFTEVSDDLILNLESNDTSLARINRENLMRIDDSLSSVFSQIENYIDAASSEAKEVIPEFQSIYDSLGFCKSNSTTTRFKAYYYSKMFIHDYLEDSYINDSIRVEAITNIDSAKTYINISVNICNDILELLFGAEVAPFVDIIKYSVADSLWSGDSITVDFILVNGGAGVAENVSVLLNIESSMTVSPESLYISSISVNDTVHFECLVLSNDTTVTDSSALQARLLAITPSCSNGFSQNKFVPLMVYYKQSPLSLIETPQTIECDEEFTFKWLIEGSAYAGSCSLYFSSCGETESYYVADSQYTWIAPATSCLLCTLKLVAEAPDGNWYSDVCLFSVTEPLLHGQIYSICDSMPIEGIELEIWDITGGTPGILFDTQTTDASGHYSFMGLISGNDYQIIEGSDDYFFTTPLDPHRTFENTTTSLSYDLSIKYYADHDCNGIINIDDLRYVIGYILDPLSVYNEVYDINNDGALTIADIRLLFEIIFR